MLLLLLSLSLSLLSPSSLSLLVLLFSNKSVIEQSKNTQFGDTDLHYFLLFIYFLGEGRKWWNKLSPVFYGVGWVKQSLWCLIASGVFRIWGISRVQVCFSLIASSHITLFLVFDVSSFLFLVQFWARLSRRRKKTSKARVHDSPHSTRLLFNI